MKLKSKIPYFATVALILFCIGVVVMSNHSTGNLASPSTSYSPSDNIVGQDGLESPSYDAGNENSEDKGPTTQQEARQQARQDDRPLALPEPSIPHPVDNEQSQVEQKPTLTCAYKIAYGDKSPHELVSESYMVSYYARKVEDAENQYQQAVKAYSHSSSDQYRLKITQAEFALNKARALYNDEFNSELDRYQKMLDECK